MDTPTRIRVGRQPTRTHERQHGREAGGRRWAGFAGGGAAAVNVRTQCGNRSQHPWAGFAGGGAAAAGGPLCGRDTHRHRHQHRALCPPPLPHFAIRDPLHQRPAPALASASCPVPPPPLPHFPIRDPLHQRPAPSETRSGTGIRIVPCAPRPSAPLTSTPSLPAPPPFRPSTLLISRPFPSLPAPSAIFRHPPCTHPRGAL